MPKNDKKCLKWLKKTKSKTRLRLYHHWSPISNIFCRYAGALLKFLIPSATFWDLGTSRRTKRAIKTDDRLACSLRSQARFLQFLLLILNIPCIKLYLYFFDFSA